jgi:hypothetical protein
MARREETGITKFLLKEEIFIDYCDGTKTISDSKEIFDLCIDPHFNEEEMSQKSYPTRKTKINVSEVVKNSTLIQIFGLLDKNHDIDKLCLTQHQISIFCRDHRNLLRGDTYGTLFLTKKGVNYYVVHVILLADSLSVYRHHLGDSTINWKGACLHRVVTRCCK